MRRWMIVAALLCLPMVGEGQAIRYYPDGATITPGKPTSQYIRYYPSVASSSTLLAGLVSYWNLDEESGTRVDSVGSNDLTDNNTVGAVLRGPEGTAASFVKANSEKLTRAAGAIPATYTFSLWVRPDSATAATDTGILTLDDAGNRGIVYLMQANGMINTWRVGAGHVNKQTTDVAIMDTWNHLVFVEDKANSRFDVYINGVKSALGSDGSDTLVTGSTIEFGNWFAGPYYGGKMAAAGMWNVPLSDADVITLLAGKNGLRYADLPAGLLTGLVSWWELDEVSGVRYDSHGSNDLTDNNTVGSVINAGDAMDGAAASFVAANSEYLSKSFDASLNITGEVTYSCWFKPSGNDNFQNLMGFDYGDAIPAFMVWFNVNVPQLAYAASGADWYRLNPGVSVDLGVWHHVVAWFDPADKMGRLQIDGGAVYEGNALAGSTLRSSSTEEWKIGRWSFGQFAGQIDEVAIWDRVLTEDERTELYAAGAGKFYPF